MQIVKRGTKGKRVFFRKKRRRRPTSQVDILKNQNAPRPSEHPPVREKMSKRFLGGIIGCKKYKTFSWHLNGVPYGSNIGPTV